MNVSFWFFCKKKEIKKKKQKNHLVWTFVKAILGKPSEWLSMMYFHVLCTAGRRRSWEDQPGVPGWEKCLGCDVLRPEALLWQHLPGVAVCSFGLSVAPSSGPGWALPRTSRTLLHYMEGPGSRRQHQHSKGSGGQQGTWWTSVTYTDPVAPGSLFLKV